VSPLCSVQSFFGQEIAEYSYSHDVISAWLALQLMTYRMKLKIFEESRAVIMTCGILTSVRVACLRSDMLAAEVDPEDWLCKLRPGGGYKGNGAQMLM
jgi:hypothetical protein